MKFNFEKKYAQIKEIISQHGDQATLHITRMLEREAFSLTEEEVCEIHKAYESGNRFSTIAKLLKLPYSRVRAYMASKDL